MLVSAGACHEEVSMTGNPIQGYHHRIENGKIELDLQTDLDGRVESLAIESDDERFFTLGPDLGLHIGDLTAGQDTSVEIKFKFVRTLSDARNSCMEFVLDHPYFDVRLGELRGRSWELRGRSLFR
jgi:hypothetical protein